MEFEMIEDILKLKKERDAMILAHHYQPEAIKAIADHVGDSLEMAKKASESTASTLIVCGVKFMAETAKLLSPEKTVLLPNPDAGCPMADMISAEDIRKRKQEEPDLKVVCYVNSSIDVKAESDICCTSSNAKKIVSKLGAKKILFVPDQNLGNYVRKSNMHQNVMLWQGFCPTHHRIDAEDVNEALMKYPDGFLLVHPECKPEVLAHADFIGSTSEIIAHCRKISATTLIIGTEEGVLSTIRQQNPNKSVHLLHPSMTCPNMKKTTLSDVYNSLKYGKNSIEIDTDVQERASKAIFAMMEISR